MNTRLSTPSLNLGVVGNAAAAALVDENASIVWMCSPRMDGDPIFCSLLGSAEAGEGVWSIDMDKRVAIWSDFQKLIYEEVPFFKVGDFSALSAQSPNLGGFTPSAWPYFWNAYIEK